MSLSLADIDAVVFDMDGVIWRGTELLPGVPDLFTFLVKRQIPYALATNNSSKQSYEYLNRLQSIGIEIDSERVVTSGMVTLESMQRTYPTGTPIYVIGSASLAQLFVDAGYVISPIDAAVVVCGLDVNLTYEKLKIAGQRIAAGAAFIGTNGDKSLPTTDGISPGNGATLAALTAMTGFEPTLMGKPEPIMFEIAVRKLGTTPQRTLMVGDRLDTDIEGAWRAGLKTAMVLSGVSTREELSGLGYAPDGIYENLADLLSQWDQIDLTL